MGTVHCRPNQPVSVYIQNDKRVWGPGALWREAEAFVDHQCAVAVCRALDAAAVPRLSWIGMIRTLRSLPKFLGIAMIAAMLMDTTLGRRRVILMRLTQTPPIRARRGWGGYRCAVRCREIGSRRRWMNGVPTKITKSFIGDLDHLCNFLSSANVPHPCRSRPCDRLDRAWCGGQWRVRRWTALRSILRLTEKRWTDCHYHCDEWLKWTSDSVDDEPHWQRIKDPGCWIEIPPTSAMGNSRHASDGTTPCGGSYPHQTTDTYIGPAVGENRRIHFSRLTNTAHKQLHWIATPDRGDSECAFVLDQPGALNSLNEIIAIDLNS